MIELLVTIIILGLVFWFIETYIPMSEPFKMLLRIVIVIICLVILLRFLGVALPGRLNI